jgi:biotin carboxylase
MRAHHWLVHCTLYSARSHCLIRCALYSACCQVIAARITAENPDEGFKPTSGAIERVKFQVSNLSIRVDVRFVWWRIA